MPTVIAIANQKGGVGKTTTTINLGAALSNLGHAVTIIDLDPQGNASTGLGINLQQRQTTAFDLLSGDCLASQAAIPTGVEGLRIIPATPDLSSVDMQLAQMRDRTQRLKRAVDCTGIVLIDCPPALGLLTVNAMVAASAVLVPLQAEFYALEGLSQLLTTVRQVRSGPNPDLRLNGVVLTMSDNRNRLSQQVEDDARATLGDLVYQTVIPRNVRLSEAPSHAVPVLAYDPQSKGSVAYSALAREFLGRITLETSAETAHV